MYQKAARSGYILPVMGALAAIARILASPASDRTRALLRGLSLLALLGFSSVTQAGMFCTDPPLNGVIDGDAIVTDPGTGTDMTTSAFFALNNITQITIDADCIFRDWPASDPLDVNLNFQTNDPSVYLITFDNVWFSGNMACANIPHRLWVVNSDPNAFSGSCQSLFIPAETVNKENPAQVSGNIADASVGIGETFTYKMTVPSMMFPVGDPSPNDLVEIYLWDDLSSAANGVSGLAGADLTMVGYTVTPVGASPVNPLLEINAGFDPIVDTGTGETASVKFCNNAFHGPKNLCLKFQNDILAGEQYVIEVTVKVDNTVQNQSYPTFANTVKWWFGRTIALDGIDKLFTPLPGESGVSDAMYIGRPDLVVDKMADSSSMNLATNNGFNIDVQNTGTTTAWDITVVDLLPWQTTPTVGTCPGTQPTLTVQVYGPGGSTSGPLLRTLSVGADYTVTYDNSKTPDCSLTVVTTSANGALAPGEVLSIRYLVTLDGTTEVPGADGVTLTNIAAATAWYSAADSGTPADREAFTGPISDGTPLDPLDNQDAQDVTTALTGYFFQKVARNLTTGEYPATIVAPGDWIRYEIRIFNVSNTIQDIVITDTLDSVNLDVANAILPTGNPPLPSGTSLTLSGDTVTFSGLNSISTAAELLIYFDVQVRNTVGNGTSISNQAQLSATVDTVPLSGILSDDPFFPDTGNGNAADPAYAPQPSLVTVQAPGSLTKSTTQTEVSIGSQFTYTVTVPASPVDAWLYDVRLLDNLTASGVDLGLVSATATGWAVTTITDGAYPNHTIVANATTGIDIPPSGQVTFTLTVEVLNTTNNQALAGGTPFINAAHYDYNRVNTNEATRTTTTAANAGSVTLLEPAITAITKTPSVATADAGDTVIYTVQLTAGNAAENSDVFDVVLIDTLAAGLTYDPTYTPTVTVGGVGTASEDNIIGNPDIYIDGVTNEETLVWSASAAELSDIDIIKGETITITYRAIVDNDVLAGASLNNAVFAQWTSQDGPVGSERDGSDGPGGALNDYATATVSEIVNIPDITTTITKTKGTDTWPIVDADVRVGDVVEYTLTVPMPEGTIGNVQIVDTLPQGLDFREVVSINGAAGPPYVAQAPFIHADIAAPVEIGTPATGTSTVTWSIGNLHNPPGDGNPDNFVIVYRAVVLNGDALAATPVDQNLQNSAELTYDHMVAGVVTPYTAPAATAQITVRQPSLSVTKSVAPAGGDLAVTGGEVVTYTIDIINSGSAPAYDALLQDTLPAGLRGTAPLTTSITLINTVGGTLASDPPDFDPTYTPATGLAEWSFDIPGSPDAYTIPVGQTLRVVYTAVVDVSVAAGLTLSNAAQVMSYYSFDNEDIPTLGVSGAREDYLPTNIAAASVYTGAGPSKALTAPASGEATIGDTLSYQIAIPATPIGSPLYDINITDTVDTRLQITGVTISGGGVNVVNGSTASVLDITADQIPAGQQILVDLQVQLQNTTAGAGDLIGNTVGYTYAFTGGGAQQTALTAAAADVTVTEPLLTLNKSLPASTPNAGDILTYTLTLTASGAGAGDNFSDAFDVSITDTLSLGLSYVPGSATVDGTGNTIADPTVTGNGDTVAQTLNWSLADANADIDVPEGVANAVTITYQVLVRNSVLPGQALTNSAVGRWTSLDGVIGGERDGSGVPAQNDYFTTAQVTTTTVPNPITITKSHLGDSWAGGTQATDVRIGDIIEYEIRVTLGEGTTGTVLITDTLPIGLEFVETASINGDATAPFDATYPFTHNQVTAAGVIGDGISSPTDLSWNIGDIINDGDNNPANDDFVIVYRARVLDSNLVNAQAASTIKQNTAELVYSDATGAIVPPYPSSSVNITVKQPVLGITSKTAVIAGAAATVGAGDSVTYTVLIENTGDAPAYDLVFQDTLPDGMRDAGVTSATISIQGGPVLGNLLPTSYDPVTGVATWDFNTAVADEYTLPENSILEIVYTVQADADLGAGLTLTNTAAGVAYYSFDNGAPATLNGVNGTRRMYTTFNPAQAQTSITSTAPGDMAKSNPAATSLTIGEEFTYRLTIPQSAVDIALYDVRIYDDLTALGADVTIVGISKVSPGGSWNPINASGTNNMVIMDALNGIDIPANEQAIIDVTLRINNVGANIDGNSLVNSAFYTYNQVDGGGVATQVTTGTVNTAAIPVVEPALTLTKASPSGPLVSGGEVLSFSLTMFNGGSSTAFDVTVDDTLPTELSFDGSFTPTATLDGAPVPGFITAPTVGAGGLLTWGDGNGDGSLDVPVGSTLVITYQAIVNASAQAGASFSNTAYANWTSLDGGNPFERTGAGCPTTAAPNSYCSAPDSVLLSLDDTNAISKAIIADSDAGTPVGQLRVGDTLTYRLSLSLQEGLTNNIVVSDVLDAGLAFAGIVNINGDTAADYTPPAGGAGSNFGYNPISAASLPAPGATGTLNFNLGNISNDPLGDPTTDILVIEYQAVVLTNTLAQVPNTSLNNTVTLVYDDATGTPITPLAGQHIDTATATVLQPVMTPITKIDPARTSPYTANVAVDVMNFQIQTCNTTGLAPAYGIVISDTLATQFDSSSLTNVVVWINGAVALPGDFIYTPPAGDGGTFTVELLQPITPGNCARIDYSIGFNTNFGPNQTWNNSAHLDEYWSLGANAGQLYAPADTAQFVINNNTTIDPPAKTMTVPVSGEATVGETVTYQIAVPATPANAALFDVTVTDTLHASLSVIGITEISGNGLTITNNSIGNDLNLVISQIPAGQQALIQIETVVANNAAADNGSTTGGTSFDNTVSYTYAVTSGGAPVAGGSSTTAGTLTLVEPELNLAKGWINASDINPAAAPGAGDIIRYTLTLTASGGAVGDPFSGAFDVDIVDDLSLGLAYQGGTATVDGGNTIVDPVISGDGITTAQTLTWNLAGGSDIDVPEGSVVTITYDVLVLDSVQAGQTLSNSAVAAWTGLDGVNAAERTGSGIPADNDYVTGPAFTSQVVQNNIAFAKVRGSDTWNAGDNNVRIGDIIVYELRATLNEGTNQNIIIRDTLPLGLGFEGVVSINGDTVPDYTSAGTFTHNPITGTITSGDGRTSSTSLEWNIGDIINAANNNSADDTFIIVYRARVLENYFSHVASTTRTNTGSLTYTIATGTATINSSIDVIVDQPILSLTKLAAPTGGDTIIDAGENVVYTVTVQNTGAAPAYDITITDVIPAGMRTTGGPSGVAMTITSGGGAVTNPLVPALVPAYDPVSGTATWFLDTPAYAIPGGETLTITYTVQADADLGPGMTLTNTVDIPTYYSFDAGTPPDPASVAQEYIDVVEATQTLTTGAPVRLDKNNTVPEATIGIPFSYRIIVPFQVQTTALNDVIITDDLGASAADLSFVSVQKISVGGAWQPEASMVGSVLTIQDTLNGGIDIPAGQQIEIEVTVVLNDNIITNASGQVFTNTANYTYNAVNDDPATVLSGLPDTTAPMTITGPDTLIMDKTGPATMRTTTPGDFRLDIQNTGTATAWDATITDLIPHPNPGGMCDVPPFNITVQLYDATGTTPIGPVLVENTDYTVSFTPGTPYCTLVFTMTSDAAAIPAGQRLFIDYSLNLDLDTPHSTLLTNIAGATSWYSADPDDPGASSQIRNYTETLTDGSTGTIDFEDAVTVFSESPVILFSKTVENVTTSQNPGLTASPGDRLRYTITAANQSSAVVTDFNITDEIDALNGAAYFAAGSLTVTNTGGGVDASNANGGAAGTGLLDIQNLTLAAQGDPGGGDVVTIVFEIDLAPVITNGTTVLNQAQLTIGTFPPAPSNDPNVNPADVADVIGDEVPTPITITSAPSFEIFKTSDDITTATTGLVAGDTLRYTITVRNIGSEDAINAVLQDSIPVNTTYLAGSTTLNGVAVADASAGVSVVEAGMSINSNDTVTAGNVTADPTGTLGAVATITFDVTINSDVLNGAIISNQAGLSADGTGSGTAPAQVSDDPDTATIDDPTRDIVGNLPLVDAVKTVALIGDVNGNGFVDENDTLRYTITVTNYGAIPATGVTLTDAVPANTTYVANTTVLNNLAVGQPDGGISPLIGGIAISSSDLTPPVPTIGTLSPGGTATVSFNVTVDIGTATGTIISNQGFVATNELPTEPTDADGDDSNGDQPTLVAVGNAQAVAISKQVLVVGGGAATAGGQLEYIIQVTNVGLTPATGVFISDDLNSPVAGQKTYVAGSATLNGLTAGINDSGNPITADYAAAYGNLAPGNSATLRFRVQLSAALAIGTTVENTAVVDWNTTQSASATVTIDIGGIPGAAILNGRIWHDANFDNLLTTGEIPQAGWSVEIYRNGILAGSFPTDSAGNYRITGLAPNDTTSDTYSLRFLAPGAGANTAILGDTSSPFTDGPQTVTNIIVGSGANVQNINLPIQPNGVVYDSVVRTPVAGATLTMVSETGSVLPANCFDDTAQQGQVTLAAGYYKFDMNFSDLVNCPPGANYQILVTVPANGYTAGESVIIPPVTTRPIPPTVTGTAPYSVPNCIADAIGGTSHCEVQTFETAPDPAIPPRTAGTDYYLYLTLSGGTLPQDSQLFNNHIPLDPKLDEAFTVTKTSAKLNVVRGDIVPYTITVTNTLPVVMTDLNIIDNFPAGFKYVEGSARVNDVATDPVVTGNTLTWPVTSISTNQQYQVKLLLIVGAGVQDGEYINRANVFSNLSGTTASGEAQATVMVVPDPTFDCTDVVGKVFHDKNLNGVQDAREPGLAGVRVATARGLIATTDEQGRYHVTCAIAPDERRGANFIMKVDERSLPTGFRITTENPRVERASRGKMLNFSFGATIHHVISMDVADGAFERDSKEIRPQWQPRIGLLIEQLRKGPAVLRLTYLADVEDAGLVKRRINALRRQIMDHWDEIDSYKLRIETEIYWRRGGPVDGGR